MPAPIAVMSFNRPGLLQQVLQSLLAQRDPWLAQREIHLFQDNAVNAYSHIRYTEHKDIADCIGVFHSIFPNGVVHLAPDNIGVCENFKRAEDYLFEQREFDCAYFFEDDMVLSPAYLGMMDHLQEQARARPGQIAYFAAYGDYYASREEIEARRDEVIALDHHWAFGLFREPWLRIREWLDPYYGIVVGRDYARRDHQAIYEMYAELGACPRGSSQDAAKAFACARLGLWRCRTVLPFAKYIGAEGAHMNRETYDRLRFGQTQVEAEPAFGVRMPDEVFIRAAVAEEGERFRQIFREELATLTDGFAAKLNPHRPATAEEVAAAYRLLLHRDPERRAIIEQHAGRTPVAALVRGILGSSEYGRLAKSIEP